MWFFMNTCYVFSLISFVMLLVAFFQSFLKFYVFAANHLTFMILTSIIYLFTETLVIFFFVGTGVSIKEYAQAHHLDAQFQKKSFAVKMKIYPPLLLNMLFLIILFILVGAVDTGHIASWIYQFYFAFCIWHFLYSKRIQNDCFRTNTENILAMSGVAAKS